MLPILACHVYAMSPAASPSTMRLSRTIMRIHLFGDCDGMKGAKFESSIGSPVNVSQPILKLGLQRTAD